MKVPLNIQIISDLHLEKYHQWKIIPMVYRKFDKGLDHQTTKIADNFDNTALIIATNDIINKLAILPPIAPILAICGDLCEVRLPIFKYFLNAISKVFEFVLFVSGNHEYHGKSITEVDNIIKKICNQIEYENVYFLQNTSLYIKKYNVIILGTTLWSHIDDVNFLKIQKSNTDFKYIYNDNHIKLSPNDTVQMYKKNVSWLQNSLKNIENENLTKNSLKKIRVVIMTHHAPINIRTSLPEFEKKIYNQAYASDLSALIFRYRPAAWIYGHCHFFVDFNLGYTRIISNPVGYKNKHENTGYQAKTLLSFS